MVRIYQKWSEQGKMSDRVMGAQGSLMSDGNVGFRNWNLVVEAVEEGCLV